ncbi:TSUP family transporter [Maribius pontilimi]|uniref:Probable membrane transporter protein n=1 Tax=Palleronia pontilimi TaxID=1964209 RepID=A0A934MD26_9RHOB|nr:TSUP family transporter [Palleronia pontilimi]MBJ3763110.1 TSUP family transporter [Palleronia pontilimi]
MLSAIAHQPGLGWLVAAAIAAGVVRGFSGFGTAMVFLPVAGQVMPPVPALVTLLAMDLLGPLPNVPAAWRVAERRDLGRLALGLVAGLPLGLGLLVLLPGEVFRYIVSITALVLLVLLVAGFRYRGAMGPRLMLGTGGIGGLFGGAAGIAGPPVILLYMASDKPVAAIRANLLLFLVIVDIAALVLLGLWGRLGAAPLVPGLALCAPYLLANVAGAAMFRPERARAYRLVSYGIIAASALTGLPIWD